MRRLGGGVDHFESTRLSPEARARALEQLKSRVHDVLIVGGGITGAAVAREASLRGLSVCLVDKGDFSSGTSGLSSKLVHGGLRYLEKLEFSLVFEALSERSYLMKAAPRHVRPLKFYFPVYSGKDPGMFTLGMGMWLYDLLALFRTPGVHQRLSSVEIQSKIQGLRSDALKGGYRYFDASMWDDVLTIDTHRAAVSHGALCLNYVEAGAPIKDLATGRVVGHEMRDLAPGAKTTSFEVRARQVIWCVGPWLDGFAGRLVGWKPRLEPSTGVHLVLKGDRLKLDGALVMPHPTDGRISFAIPRPDLGPGIVFVGTTDRALKGDDSLEAPRITSDDVTYLLGLLNHFFPKASLTRADVVSTTIGVRPLVRPEGASSLQSVSREHTIETTDDGVVWVAGGKYTTHRSMAVEIVDAALIGSNLKPTGSGKARSQPLLSQAYVERDEELVKQYDLEIRGRYDCPEDPPGFDHLFGKLLFGIRVQGVMHLHDFILRRQPLVLALGREARVYFSALAQVLAAELGSDASEELRQAEFWLKHRTL